GKFRFPWTVEGELLLLLALPILFLPWTPLVRVRGPGALLAWPWVVGLLAVYSLPGLKHPHYVVPALAPLAVLASAPRPGAGRWSSAAGLLVLAVGAGLALRFPLSRPGLPAPAGVAPPPRLPVRALAPRAVLAGEAVRVCGAILPRAVPPPVPAWVAERAGSRQLFTATQNPGLYSFLLGRQVHRVSGEGAVLRALEDGQGLLVTRDEREQLPP